MNKLGGFVVVACLLLQGCGWESKTRLIPQSERETPGLSGVYDLGEDSASFSAFSRAGLQNMSITTGSGTTYALRNAYDLVQVSGSIESGVDQREFTYLVESQRPSQDQPKFTYDLISVRKVYGENDRFTGDYNFSRYDLKCAEATARLNRNPESSSCEFTSYRDLMSATNDVLRWMSDPRISLRYQSGIKR